MTGEYLLILFTNRSNEKTLLEKIKENFGIFRAVRRLDISSINDNCIKLEKQVLS